MMGDGECSEGSVWEAMAFASHYQLDNLVAIMDVNRLGQSEAAPLKHDMETHRKRCEAFGLVPPSPFLCPEMSGTLNQFVTGGSTLLFFPLSSLGTSYFSSAYHRWLSEI